MKRILIVEDDQASRDVLSKILKKEQFEVHTFADGNEALILLQKKHFNLVITDLSMPRIHGFELIRQIRHEFKMGIPIIVFSAMDAREYTEKARLLGVDDYVTKPLDIVRLLSSIRSQL